MTKRPICDYENSDYQKTFWDDGSREYEDLCEARAIKRLMPAAGGRLLLELGAGAGRNTARYAGYERIVLLDYSRTQLQQAQERLGTSGRFLFIAADIYSIPFVDGLFDSATMIRTLHHLSDPPAGLCEIRRVLQPDSFFLLEYANKRNLKSILRYLLRRQAWNPFTREAIEYLPLNFDFHPATVRTWLSGCGFQIFDQATVSHFRIAGLKRIIPSRVLSFADYLLGFTGNIWQLSPSVFIKATSDSSGVKENQGFFQCPHCKGRELKENPLPSGGALDCLQCKRRYLIRNGVYDFKEPLPL